MGVEKMSGIYIPGAKIPDGDYVRVLMLHKDGTCVDGIGNVFNVIPVPPHGDLIDREKLYEQTANWEAQALDQTLRYRPEEDRDEWRWWSAVLKERSAFKFDVADAPTIIPASEEAE